MATEFWKQDKIQRRNASTLRKFKRTTRAGHSSLKYYFKLSRSKPNESIWWQNQKLGVFLDNSGRTMSLAQITSSFSKPSLCHGERLHVSWDNYFKPGVDSRREKKHDLQFKGFGSIFQAYKCGLQEISVHFSYTKYRRGNRGICKSTEKDGFVNMAHSLTRWFETEW